MEFGFLMPLTIMEYILKRKMIQRRFVNEETQAAFKTHNSDSKHSSLKWGLLAHSGGLVIPLRIRTSYSIVANRIFRLLLSYQEYVKK